MGFESSNESLSTKVSLLVQENIQYHDTQGISGSNVEYGFSPAFINNSTGEVYRSSHRDGRPALVHLYDGLPDSVISKRDHRQNPIAVIKSIVSGFVYNDAFYTREQAIELLAKM